MKTLVLAAAATTTALMAGLFFAWSCSVTLGLARLTDEEYISAMQAINRAILNPVFFSCFFGSALLLPLSTYLYYDHTLSIRFGLLLVASLLYLLGVMGVTILGNVPLNEALDAFNLASASTQELAAQRTTFEGPWNQLNIIRTIASTLAIIMLILACLQPVKSPRHSRIEVVHLYG